MSKNDNFDTNATLLITVLFWWREFYFGLVFDVGSLQTEWYPKIMCPIFIGEFMAKYQLLFVFNN